MTDPTIFSSMPVPQLIRRGGHDIEYHILSSDFELFENFSVLIGDTEYPVPPPDSKLFKNYSKCNSYRCFDIIIAIKGQNHASISAEYWKLAPKVLKEFFKRYSKEIDNRKKKGYKIKLYVHTDKPRRKRSPNKKKVVINEDIPRELEIMQEKITSDRFRSDIDSFTFHHSDRQ